MIILSWANSKNGSKTAPYEPSTPEQLLELLNCIEGIDGPPTTESETKIAEDNNKYAGKDSDGFTYIKINNDIDFSTQTHNEESRLGVHHAICRNEQKIYIFSGSLTDTEKLKTSSTSTTAQNKAIKGLCIEGGLDSSAQDGACSFFFDHGKGKEGDCSKLEQEDCCKGQLIIEHVDFLNCTFRPKKGTIDTQYHEEENVVAYYSNCKCFETKLKMYGCSISLRVIRPIPSNDSQNQQYLHTPMVDCLVGNTKGTSSNSDKLKEHQKMLQVLMINCNEYIELISFADAQAIDGLGAARIGCTTEVHGLLATEFWTKNSSNSTTCVIFRAGPIVKSAFLLYVTHCGVKQDDIGNDTPSNDIGKVGISITGGYQSTASYLEDTKFYCENCCFAVHITTKYCMENDEQDAKEKIEQSASAQETTVEGTENETPTDPHGNLNDPDFHENFDVKFSGEFVGVSIIDVDILPTHAHLVNISFPTEQAQTDNKVSNQITGKVLGLSTSDMKNQNKLKEYGFIP